MSVITDLKVFASERNINLINQMKIAEEASINITRKYNFTTEEIKENFDMLLRETEQEAYRVYLSYEKEYGKSVLTEFYNFLIESKMISKNTSLFSISFFSHWHNPEKQEPVNLLKRYTTRYLRFLIISSMSRE